MLPNLKLDLPSVETGPFLFGAQAVARKEARLRKTEERAKQKAPVDWHPWLLTLFPKDFGAPFAAHHARFWEYVWHLQKEIRPRPYVALWPRGGGKTILPEEQPVIDFAYATVVTIAPVRSGEVFDRENVWVKRPGTGPILANRLDDVIGKKATRDLPAEVQVAPADIAGF